MTRPTDPVLSRPRLWTTAFVSLCATIVLGFSHFALLTPTVPLYVIDQGGSALTAGLVLLTFSGPSFLIRPFFGHLSDTWSATGVLMLGLLLLALGGILYVVPFLAVLIVASAVRGFGWGGLNTGAYTLLAHTAPLNRRGEASGYYTAATACPGILFPALALWLVDAPFAGFDFVFALGSGLALAALVLSQVVLRRHAPATRIQPLAEDAPATKGSGMYRLEPAVMLATGLSLCATLTGPAVLSFIPLYARDLGIGNVAFYFLIAGATSILCRPLVGRSSDTMGRAGSLALGFAAQFAGLAFLLIATNLPMLLIGGMLTAFALAVNSATTTALAMDVAEPNHRGKAMATFSTSFQMGQGFGAILAGSIADLAGYRAIYAAALAITAIGTAMLATKWKSLERLGTQPLPSTTAAP